jgi:Tol biopolymer transport system component
MNRLTQALLAATMTVAPFAAQADSEQETLPLEGDTEVLSFTTDEGSWLSIDVTPEGDSLIFDLLGDLYRLPIEGGEAVRITSGLGYDSQPVISPDGNRIAFISDRDGATNLWVADIDGANPRQLSSERHAGMISPEWTPDGDYLIVTRVGADTELVMFHVDGGSGVTLTGSGGNERFWGVGAETSPDGGHLYFAKGQGSRRDIPASQINRYAFATGDIEPLTQGEGGCVSSRSFSGRSIPRLRDAL